MGHRFIRIGALLFVLLATARLIWPQATGHLSTKAVVNAPLLTIRAPINGSVQSPSPDLASPVTRDTQILELTASRESRIELQRLDARRSALMVQIDALLEEENVIRALSNDMRVRQDVAREIHVSFIEVEIGRETANRAANLVALEHRRDAQLRLEELESRGSAPQSSVREARLDAQLAQANINVSDARIAALEIEHAATVAGVTSPQGIRRGDYFIERADEIYLRLADLRTRQVLTRGELVSVEQLHAALAQDREMLIRFQPTAAFDAIIWTASNETGTDVNAGDDVVQLLDCQNRFIEASFPERAFESLSPGMIANVQLRGSSVHTQAVIMARHAVDGNRTSAIADAFTDNTSREGVTVFLKLEPADITDPSVAAAFCDVGREAEVHIPYDRIGFDRVMTWVRTSLRWPAETAPDREAEQISFAPITDISGTFSAVIR